jgi:hypothetical protein
MNCSKLFELSLSLFVKQQIEILNILGQNSDFSKLAFIYEIEVIFGIHLIILPMKLRLYCS